MRALMFNKTLLDTFVKPREKELQDKRDRALSCVANGSTHFWIIIWSKEKENSKCFEQRFLHGKKKGGGWW
jgi:hypothetical protein